MPKLFKDEKEDSEELKINNEYATNYDTWRQKEELHKLKARYGEDVEILANSEGESSESSEDDEGEEIPQEFEKNFYKTLACLKNKDPRIYNEEVTFFNDVDVKGEKSGKEKKAKKEKSLFLRDYERKIIVEKGGKFSDSEEDDEEKQKASFNPTYVQEQQQIKESFKKVLQDEDESDQEGLLLKPKTKTQEEAQKEEADFTEWLKGQQKEINEEEKKELKPLRDFWTDPNLDKKEKFLRDYILNKKFLDRESTDANLDYDHMAHDSDENLSEDEKNINQQEEFEHKYNFRFEEPDQEFIKRYPRTLENSLRRKDTRRAQKRSEVKARKEEEKVKKREELKQLKALKRKEIEEKIDKLKEITGNDDVQFNMLDLEGDFDPDEYDKKMSQIFNEDYYAGEEGDMKPEFPEIDEEIAVESTWDNYDPNSELIEDENVAYHDGPHCEDDDFNMDAEYDGQNNLQTELTESTKKKKKRRRSKFAEMISKKKPKFDPAKYSSYKEYYDQYYALDYEDMIGDLPCRFKYRQVVPNDYGLTVEEILMADDKELNKWCSLKRALQYKPDHAELNDVKMYKQKAANEALKKKILKSLYSTPEEENEPTATATGAENQEQQESKKKRKRKRKSKANGEINEDGSKQNVSQNEKPTANGKDANESKTVKNKTKKSKLAENGNDTEIQSPAENAQLAKENKKNAKKRKLEDGSKQTVPQNEKPTANGKDESKTVKNKTKQSKLAENGNDTEIQSPAENVQLAKENKKNAKKRKLEETVENNGESDSVEKKNKKKKNTNQMDKNKGNLSKKEQRKLLFKKSKEKKGKPTENDQIASLSAERLKAYGLNPKKFKNKLKYMKKK